jgi:choline dehydrogenase-like flavoprotein
MHRAFARVDHCRLVGPLWDHPQVIARSKPGFDGAPASPPDPQTRGVVTDPPEEIRCDLAIIGSGMAGATVAWALRESGAEVLVIEQGDFLPREWQNWSPREVYQLGRYKNSESWLDRDGNAFTPSCYHYVGGNTKFFGTTLARMREHDFGPIQTHDGISPAWPISYADLEPHYGTIEARFAAHEPAGDPTEPWRSTPHALPPVPHDPAIEKLATSLRRQGRQPFTLAQAVDYRPGGRCVLCPTCDGYPCLLDAKGDADIAAMRPALASPTVKLLTRSQVTRLVTSPDGSEIAGLTIRRDQREHTIVADRYVVAAGAVNSAALLLRSRNASHPGGVANSSDQVGRNYMAHTCSAVMGVRPGREMHIEFGKTLGLNDWYSASPDDDHPLGNVASLGKLFGPTIAPARPRVPMVLLEWLTRRSVDFFLQTEDIPLAQNRVQVEPSGQIRLVWRPTNVEPHQELVRRVRRALRRAGFPFTFAQSFGIEGTAHQCGTARMGDDPGASVVDRGCRTHDVENLWIVDSSVFPSSAAVNPALTVGANALRIALGGALTA